MLQNPFTLFSHSPLAISGHLKSAQEQFFLISFFSTLLPGLFSKLLKLMEAECCCPVVCLGVGEVWCLHPGLILPPLSVLGPRFMEQAARALPSALYHVAVRAPQNGTGALGFLWIPVKSDPGSASGCSFFLLEAVTHLVALWGHKTAGPPPFRPTSAPRGSRSR